MATLFRVLAMNRNCMRRMCLAFLMNRMTLSLFSIRYVRCFQGKEREFFWISAG